MTTASLYAFARRHGHSVFHRKLNRMDSVSVLLEDGSCVIGIDCTNMTDSQEKTQLAHEIGHCETGSFYSRYVKVDSRQRHENRADRWAIQKLIPKNEFNKALENGHTELWDLADYFEVTEDFMKKVICLYRHGNLAVDMYL